jgi:heat shock protein HslJ
MAVVLAACGEGSDAGATPSSDAETSSTSATSDTAAPDTTSAVPPSQAPDLVGTDWSVTEYVLESGSLTNLWPDTEITLSFEGQDTFAGFSGCNNYLGRFEVAGPYDEFEDGTRDPNDGQAIRITDLAYTEKACSSPNNVMTQETEYFAALQQAGRWVVVRGSLSLRTEDGFALILADSTG